MMSSTLITTNHNPQHHVIQQQQQQHHHPHRPQQQQQHPPNNRTTKTIAGYTLQRRLGSGSFATVHLGIKYHPTQTQTITETVAIKAITRSVPTQTKKLLENLETEIAILRTYRHPNIVVLHDVHRTAQKFYLILEYCCGGDVQRLIRTRQKGRLSEKLTRRLMRDLTRGLKFLWDKQLIHRDLKPQNLLLTGLLPLEEVEDAGKSEKEEEMRRKVDVPSAEFTLKIADFGFARHLQSASLADTLCGSPLYMAPEILQHHRYDAKADLWSVGTVLFEMIAGHPPFHGENHIDLLRNIQRKAVRLPPGVKVSPECVNLLRLLLNRNPLSRAGFETFFEASDVFVALGCNDDHLGRSDRDVACDDGTEGSVEREDGELAPKTTEGGGSARRAVGSTGTSCGALSESDKSAVGADLRPVSDTSDPLSSQRRVCDDDTTTTNVSHQGAAASSINAGPATGPIPIQPSFHHSNSSKQYQQQRQQQQQHCGILAKQYSHFAPLAPSPPGPKPINTSPAISIPPQLSLDNGGPLSPKSPPFPVPVPIFSNQPIRYQNHNSDIQQHQLSHHHNQQHKQNRSKAEPSSQHSVDENDFVMVERNDNTNSVSPSTSQLSNITNYGSPKAPSKTFHRLSSKHSPTSSTDYPATANRTSTNAEQPTNQLYNRRGMLSTSPRTGRALVAMMTPQPTKQHATETNPPPPTWQPFNKLDTAPPNESTDVELAAKMLAAAEDVGRRAVNVAHLGDTRAYLAMKMMMVYEGGSSLLSSAPMEGVIEEDEEDDNMTEDDDLSSNFKSSNHSIRHSTERRISAAPTTTTLHKVPEDDYDEDDEMPFAIETTTTTQPTPPLVASSTSSFPSTTRPHIVSANSSLTHSSRHHRTSAMTIRIHFHEALNCYLKALSLMKGALSAAQLVMDKLTLNQSDNRNKLLLLERCDLSLDWLGGQFTGVLERADAASHEVKKTSTSENDTPETVLGVEELIYNHALSCGRDGAVKQLLGQYDAAKASYRSAGLLAESLLMEALKEDDRMILEGYVDGFAERICELDGIVVENRRQSNANKNDSVIGLVGPPREKQNVFGVDGRMNNVAFSQLPRPPFCVEKWR